MARIVITWELGGGTGHLHTLAPLIKGLLARGHHVDLISRDLIKAGKLFSDLKVNLYSAPVWTGRATGLPGAANYGDVLLRTGYSDPEGMSVLVKGWLSLYRVLKPDIIVCEHSPTAVLAARIAHLPCAMIGTGFTVPKAGNPFPSITPWKRLPDNLLEERTGKALDACNRVLEMSGGDPMSQLSELMEVEYQAVASFPEMDHYGPREGVDYYGPLMDQTPKPRPVWPQGKGPRVFVYFHHSYRQFPGFMKALMELDFPTLVVSSGVGRQMASRFSPRHLSISRQQVEMKVVAEEADVIFSHSPHGLVSEFLRLGRASILLPNYVEQAMLAYRVKEQGLGVGASSNPRRINYRDLVEELLSNRKVADKAAGFARRYQSYSQEEAVATLLDSIESSSGAG